MYVIIISNDMQLDLNVFCMKHQVGINEELRLQQVGYCFCSIVSEELRSIYSIHPSPCNIGHNRRYITLDAYKTLGHALITSWLDYCNALLYGLPSTLMTRLQKVQNSSARLVTRTHKREYITPVLKSLHWLPVIYRSQYNILMYTSRDLEELVVPYHPTRSLRSESGAFLAVPTTRGLTYGNRCFRKAAATL